MMDIPCSTIIIPIGVRSPSCPEGQSYFNLKLFLINVRNSLYFDFIRSKINFAGGV